MWKARRSVRLPSNCDEQQRKAILLRPGPNQLLKLERSSKDDRHLFGRLISSVERDYKALLEVHW